MAKQHSLPTRIVDRFLDGHLSVILIVGFFAYAFRSPKLVPRGAQAVGEAGYLFIRDGIARDVIGKEGDRFVPFLFSLFFLIWLNNFFGIVPFAQIPTTSICQERLPLWISTRLPGRTVRLGLARCPST